MPTSLGPAEILVILVVALIVLGPERLPKAARQIGKAVAEVRHWSGGIQDKVRSAFNGETAPGQTFAPPPAPAPPPPSSDSAANGALDTGGPVPPPAGAPDGPSLN